MPDTTTIADPTTNPDHAATLAALPPTPEEIDAEIAFYRAALKSVQESERIRDHYKRNLTLLVDRFGAQPAGAEQSLRLAGRRNTVTVTRGTTTVINESAVFDLERYLGELGGQIFDRLFTTVTKHKLLEGARDLLKKLTLPRRTEEKVLSLFGRCFDVKANAPSVKVELVNPEKPTRKPRAKKEAA